MPRGRTFSVLYEIIGSFSDLAIQYGTKKGSSLEHMFGEKPIFLYFVSHSRPAASLFRGKKLSTTIECLGQKAGEHREKFTIAGNTTVAEL